MILQVNSDYLVYISTSRSSLHAGEDHKVTVFLREYASPGFAGVAMAITNFIMSTIYVLLSICEKGTGR